MSVDPRISFLPASQLSLPKQAALWNEAFTDYYVPMQLSVERYSALLQRELVSLADSIVAIADGRPVGFALAGLRRHQGQLWGYDAGTAVIKAYRRQGIAQQLMQMMLARLKAIGARRMTLTAVSANQPAISLYEQLGFQTRRQLACWELTKRRQRPTLPVDDLSYRYIPACELQSLRASCYRQLPEWQNLPAGEKLASAEALVAYKQEEPVGYALFAGGSTSYIYQLGVLPAWRRQGFASAILQQLISGENYARIVYLNSPEEEQEASDWLGRQGFEVFLRQVEMQLLY